MTLIVGVSAIYSKINYSTYENAYWMGEVVTAEDTWLQNTGYISLMYTDAGSDTETSSSYATYSYVSSYLGKEYATDPNNFIFDFGDAGSCPTGSYSATGKCANWTQGQILDLSWQEIYALPLPEDYNTVQAQAQQWYWLSIGSIRTGDGPIRFDGELTQYQACQQRGGCSGTNNLPSTGWSFLYNEIWSNTSTRPGDVMWWSDDIRYIG